MDGDTFARTRHDLAGFLDPGDRQCIDDFDADTRLRRVLVPNV